jgi:hypothetical protein
MTKIGYSTLGLTTISAAVGNGGGEAEILLDQQHREAALLDRADGAADLLHNHGREALGGFVEQQQARAGAQDTGDRQHLLLAAGEFRALAGRALLQVGEQRVDGREVEPAGRDGARQQQVLGDIERGEDAALLGTEGDAGAGNLVRAVVDQVVALVADGAAAAADQAHDALHRGGLARRCGQATSPPRLRAPRNRARAGCGSRRTRR